MITIKIILTILIVIFSIFNTLKTFELNVYDKNYNNVIDLIRTINILLVIIIYLL